MARQSARLAFRSFVPFGRSNERALQRVAERCPWRRAHTTLALEPLEFRLLLNGTVFWDDVDSHKWIAEQWDSDPIELDWVEFDGRQCLQARVTSSTYNWAVIRTDAFPAESWEGKVELQADIYQAGGASGIDVKLEVRGPGFDAPDHLIETIYCFDLQESLWNDCTWSFNTADLDYAEVSHLSIVFDHLSGTTPTFYVDNMRLITESGEEEWDDMDDGSRQWFYFGNWLNWGSATPFGLEPVSHLGDNPTTPAGALYLRWDYYSGVDPTLNSAEIGTSQLDDMPDWSGYTRIAADVKVSDPDVPISVFLWDSDTATGFGTPTRKAGAADSWQTLVWEMPWPPWFDSTDIDEIKFVVNGIDEHTTGKLYLDNIVLVPPVFPDPVGGLDYSFAPFEREKLPSRGNDVTDFSSNWGELIGDHVTATVLAGTAAEDSRASLQVHYDLPEDSFTGLWFSLWGHSEQTADSVNPKSIDLTDIFGDLSGEDKDFEQIEFWVRGSGLTNRRHNVKIELKDATDEFDRTAYRYITIDDSNTTWRRVVLDADVTNASFWSYNLDPPDPTSMKFLVFVVESYFNDPFGTFYIDNIQFVDADDSPFDPEQQSEDAFLDLISERTFLYFLDWYDPATGLFYDRSEFPDLMSIAATGFGLTALTIGENRGWIDRQDAINMITRTLEKLLAGQSPDDTVEDAIADTNGYKGFYYHFLDNEGKRKDLGSELSSVDTAILIMGALTAKEHFSDFPDNDIPALVEELCNRVEWDWMLDSATNRFYHGWKPELDDVPADFYTISAPGGGYFSSFLDGSALQWDYYTDEVMLINILAIASPTHPVPDDVFYAWQRDTGTYGGHSLVRSWNGSFFTYFFAHLWIDFRPLGRDNPPPGGPIAVDWWENSVQGTLANRQFAIDHADDQVGDGDWDYATYGASSFGLTAADGPKGSYHAYGALPAATQPQHDGTIAVYGAGSAIMFQPEIAIDALKHYFSNTELWNYRLGFGDAYNLDPCDCAGPWYHRALFGIDNGPMLIAIENYRSGFVWETIRGNTEIDQVLRRLFALDSGPIDGGDLPYLGWNYVSFTSGELPVTTSWVEQDWPGSDGFSDLHIAPVEGPTGEQEGALRARAEIFRCCDSHYKDAETFVDLRYRLAHPPEDAHRPVDCGPVVRDLAGAVITVDLRLDESLHGSPHAPNGTQIFLKSIEVDSEGNETWSSYYGTWHNAQAGWQTMVLNVATDAPAYVDLDFDASQVALLGIKLGTNTEATGCWDGWMDVAEVSIKYDETESKYDFENIEDAISRLAQTGANTVALVDHWFVNSLTAAEVQPDPLVTQQYPGSPAAAIEDTIERFHAEGLTVHLKPHLDVRGFDYAEGEWRGQIRPCNVGAFFTSYKEFIGFYAEIAERTGAEGLVVETELVSLDTDLNLRSHWEDVVDSLRGIYSGTLIVAANWDSYQDHKFVDLVDVVGIDAYFPLTDAPDPTMEELKAAWRNCQVPGYEGRDWAAEIAAWCATLGKPFYFSEIGIQSREGAAVAPGSVCQEGTAQFTADLQVNYYEATLDVFFANENFGGLLGWNWFPWSDAGGVGDIDFTPQNKQLEDEAPRLFRLPVNLDVDDNASVHALTDGLLILRCLFGYQGTILTDDVLGSGAKRTDPAEITAYLDACRDVMLDPDDNGSAAPLTDGLLILRYMFGYQDTTLTDDVLGDGAQRTDPAEIIAFLDSFKPASTGGGASQSDAGSSLSGGLDSIAPEAVDRIDLSNMVSYEPGLLARIEHLDSLVLGLLSDPWGNGERREAKKPETEAIFADEESLAAVLADR